MKFYVAYKFTGEDPKELKETLKHICDLLTKKGHNNYCSFFDPTMVDIGNKNVINKAFKKIDSCDALLVFIKSKEKSEGMLMEIGYAFAKDKKIFLIIKKGINLNYIDKIADKIIEYENLNDLKNMEMNI